MSQTVQAAIYGLFADSATAPTVEQISARLRRTRPDVLRDYAELAARRLLVLEPDGETIRMASPFSGVPTQHRVLANCREYFANCAWDALGIAAALRVDAEVRSRCEQSGEPLCLTVRQGEAPISKETIADWRFHTPIPAAHWLDDIVFT